MTRSAFSRLDLLTLLDFDPAPPVDLVRRETSGSRFTIEATW